MATDTLEALRAGTNSGATSPTTTRRPASGPFGDRNKENLPSTPRPEYEMAAPDIQLIRDLLAGTRQMHANYKTYIPKWAAEKAESYKKRATAAKVYGGLARSLSASVGMLFAKPPLLGDSFTDELRGHWENLDAKGTHGDVLAKRKAEDAIADGFTAILVDFAKVPAGLAVTAANEQSLNLRPLWCSYTRADILSWRTAVVENVETLVQVVLREAVADPSGKFGIKVKLQYRVLSLSVIPAAKDGEAVGRVASWQILEEVKQANGEIEVRVVDPGGPFLDQAGAPFREIPLAIGYAGRTDGILVGSPPLVDLAYGNLEHWRIACDLRYYEQLCAYPQPFIEGELAPTGQATADGAVIPPKFQMGPTVLWHLTPGSKAGFIELAGSSLVELRAALQEKKDEMGELGASFLRKIVRGVESAEAKRLDAAAENATLATSAQGVEDMLNEALRFHGLYMGIPAVDAPTLGVNRDFEGLLLDAPVMVAYVSAVKDAGLPPRLLLEAFQAGGRIDPEADLDKLEMEMLANAAATAEQAKQTQQDQMTGSKGKPKPAKRGPVLIQDATGKTTHRLVPE